MQIKVHIYCITYCIHIIHIKIANIINIAKIELLKYMVNIILPDLTLDF